MNTDDWTAAKAEAMEAELLAQATSFRRVTPPLTGLVGLLERAASMIQTQRLLLGRAESQGGDHG